MLAVNGQMMLAGFGALLSGAGAFGEQQSRTKRLRSVCISWLFARPARTALRTVAAWGSVGTESR